MTVPMPDNPEFELPFTFNSSDGCDCIEQGSYEEIQQRIYVIMLIEPGQLPDYPDIGVPNQLFRKGGVDLDTIETTITDQVPDANVVVDNDPNWFMTLVDTISIRRAI